MSVSLIQAQRDFTAGQLNASLKRRDDDALVKTGARVAQNWRPISSAPLDIRPGRRPIWIPPGTRNEYVAITSGLECILSFSSGAVTVYSLTGSVLLTSSNSGTYLWRAGTLAQISWAQAQNDIVVCFAGMRPQVIHWEPATGAWSIAAFAWETLDYASQEPFYRFSVPGATMTMQTQSGSGISIVCSQPYFTNAMAGKAIISILGQQMSIDSVTDSTHATGTVWRLPDFIQFLVTDASVFAQQQVVKGAKYGRTIEVCALDTGSNFVYGLLMDSMHAYGPHGTLPASGVTGVPPEELVGPLGQSDCTAANVVPYNDISPTYPSTVQWSEQFMSDLQGWPAACFSAHGRLGFCDFPQKPEAILWLSIGNNKNGWIDPESVQNNASAGASADSAILEFMTGHQRVRNVVEWGDEFVFTSRGVYQVPVDANDPLKPGSVLFRRISDDRCSGLKPVATRNSIVFTNEAASRVSMIVRTGSYTSPYAAQDFSDSSSDLFNNIVTLAIATGDAKHPERYIYVVNGDGSLVVGREVVNGISEQGVGWFPWPSTGVVNWVTVAGANVYLTSTYNGNTLLEVEDDSYWLDGLVLVNAVPSALVVGGKGPIWWMAGQTVTLMDGLRDMGERSVDANGNILAIQGEDLTSATLVAGQWTDAVFEPFVPNAQSGQDENQRQRPRRIRRIEATVQNSSGSLLIGKKLIPPYFFGDDPTQAPPLREDTYRDRPMGRSYDPRVQIIKTRPGPCRLNEVSLEVTV